MIRKIAFALLPLFLATASMAQEKTETEEDAPAKSGCGSSSSCCKNGNKVWYVSPIKFTENGVGFELGYERGIDKGGIVAYNLPLVATFNLAHDELNMGNKQDAMVYFMPGIKFYPTSAYGKVKYALGPSLVIGVGQQTDRYDYYINPFTTYPYPVSNHGYVTRDKELLGVMINNSLNINPSDHFTLGLDFGFGFTYINMLDGVTQNMKGLVQGGFKMGYRL